MAEEWGAVSLRTAFFGALTLTVLPSLGAAIAIERYVEAQESARGETENQEIKLRAATDEHVVSLLNQEVGLRGYLATGDERFLQPYLVGRGQEVDALVALESMVRAQGDGKVRSGLDELETAARRWHDFIEAEIVRRRLGPLVDLPQELIEGKRLFDAIRERGNVFREANVTASRALSALRTAEVSRARRLEVEVLVAILVAASLAIAWVLRKTAGPIALLARAAMDGTGYRAATSRLRLREVEILSGALRDRDHKVEAREEELRKEHDRAVGLRGFVERMQQHVDEREVAADIARTFARRHGATGVQVARLSASENRLAPLVPPMEDAERQRHLVLLDPTRCRALRASAVVLVDDANSEAACVCTYGVPDEGGYACFPMTAGSEQVGLVNVRRSAGAWSGDEKAALETYVSSAATAISAISLLRSARESAFRDGLTGTYNRRFLDELLPKVISQALRSGKPLSLLMLDIDHFKRFNDSFGHDTGDRVLTAFARCLERSVRAGDVVARFGGEEFAAVLPDTTRESAAILGERLRGVVAAIHFEDRRLAITASIGIGCLPDDSSDRDGLVRAADAALYRAKADGRNRVAVSGGPAL